MPQGAADDNFDDGEDDQPYMGQGEPGFVQREPQGQPYLPRDAQPFPPRDQQVQQHQRPQQHQPYSQPQPSEHESNGLPAFITGNAPQPQMNGGPNGYEQGGERNDRNDRFGGHHRRRRRRGGFRPDRPDVNAQPGNDAPEHSE